MDQNLCDNTRRHHRSDTPPWVLGGVFIMIGVFLLLRNLTGMGMGNWWALFILIPAFTAFAHAWRLYQAQGRFTEAVGGGLIGGTVLLFVFGMLFFGWNWGTMWPVLLILAGIGTLAGVVLRK